MATQQTTRRLSPPSSPSPSPPPYSPSPLPKGRLIILNGYPWTAKQAVLIPLYNQLTPIYTHHYPNHPWPIRILDTHTLIDVPLLSLFHGAKTLQYYNLRWQARKKFFREVCETAALMGQTILLAEELAETESDLTDFLQFVETKRRMAPGLEMHWLTWNYEKDMLEKEIVAMDAKGWAEVKAKVKVKECLEETWFRRQEGVRKRLDEVRRHPGLLRASVHVVVGEVQRTCRVMDWREKNIVDEAVAEVLDNLGVEMSAITQANLRLPDGIEMPARLW